MKCEKCGSEKITYYKQIIKSGRVYVAARCENGHSPIKGKPFYPVWQFDVSKLPKLPSDEEQEEKQEELFLFQLPKSTEKKTTQPYKNFPQPIENL